jgi:hypothetical protein
MNVEQLMGQMKQNARAIGALVEGCPAGRARWRPEPSSWSLLEVVNHLLDEEREDFHACLEVVLNRPEEGWPCIDPPGWVTTRGYNQRELGPSLGAFLAEREDSLRWLSDLNAVDWDTSYQAPFGPIKAGDLLTAWAAHDLLHMRQLVEIRYAVLMEEAEPYGVPYAGPW